MTSDRARIVIGVGVLLLGAIPAVGARGEPWDPATFTSRVRPILSRCVACHGGDEPAGELDLSTRDSALKGGESGPAVRPGDASASRAYRMAASRKMPPKRPLSGDEVEALRLWIDAGATWDGPPVAASAPAETPERSGRVAWALRTLARPDVPATRDPAWALDPIDAFVLARLEAKGLRPAPAADRATLIRRVSFDLKGLPPSPEEVDAFVADPSPRAYEALVDRLLASPRYGERWGRHWLDVARFSESHGFEFDRLREHAWRYRDYVIRSLNADRSYFHFAREQIAGDLLAPGDHDGITATGFLVSGPWDEAGNALQSSAVMRKRMREEELEDMVAAVGQTFLGMTVNCARCHDHKFDPIPQRDYYRLKSALEGVRHGNRPLLPAPDQAVYESQVEALKAQIKSTRAELDRLKGAGAGAGPLDSRQARRPDDLSARLKALGAALAAIPTPPSAYAARPEAAGPTYVLARGDVESPVEPVSPGGLSAVEGLAPDFGLPPDAPEGLRRLRLAEWVAHPGNPLTARVAANRLWHYHFGTGLVASPNDFGEGGDGPTHPELLDWLACELLSSGGSLKALHRRIVTSSTYRQSSRFEAKAAAVDAEGRLLWRFPPRRLEAESARDAMLAVAGTLNEAMGGPSFRPFTVKVFGSNLYTPTDPIGPEYDRRTVYRMNVDSAKDPLLESLDCPDPSVKTPRRAVTTTPAQALALLNDTFVWRQARGFARRVELEAGDQLSAKVDRAYRLALGRPPADPEHERAMALVRDNGLEVLCWALFNASEFLSLE